MVREKTGENPRNRQVHQVLIVFITFVLVNLSCKIGPVNQIFGLYEDANTLDYFLSGMDSKYEVPPDARDEDEDPVVRWTMDSRRTSQAEAGIKPDFEWSCRDIAGEISALRSSSETEVYGLKVFKLIALFNRIKITSIDSKQVLFDYELEIERDEAEVDSETETIKAWNHVQWTKKGSAPVTVSWKGVFAGEMDVDVVQTWTYPGEGGRSETKESHAFFGLIPPDNIFLAYLCDRRANPIPEGLENLTPGNFRNYCTPGYYYECQLK